MKGEIIKIGLAEYHKCSNIWDMKNSPHTEHFINQIQSGSRTVYIYKIGDAFIAEGSLVSDSDEEGYTIPNRRVYLSHLIVKKAYRGRGLGTIMLNFLIAEAVAAGYSEASAGVDCDNGKAIHLYEKAGFSVFEKCADEYGEYYKMLKIL